MNIGNNEITTMMMNDDDDDDADDDDDDDERMVATSNFQLQQTQTFKLPEPHLSNFQTFTKSNCQADGGIEMCTHKKMIGTMPR